MFNKRCLLFLFFILLHDISVNASDGTLDPAFGGGSGFVLTPPGANANSIGVQIDGKIVALGADVTNTITQIVRYTSSGSLDTSFGGTGIVMNDDIFASDLIIQPDGKIIIVGTNNPVPLSFVLVRYNEDGTIDTSFGTNGLVSQPLGGATSVTLQADSKIVVAGTAPGSTTMQVVRYQPDGTLETIFDPVPISLGATRGIVIQADGKILVGSTDPAGTLQVVRFNSDGSLDMTYGIAGIAKATGVITQGFMSLILQPDGKAIVADTRNQAGVISGVLARFTTLGTLDPTYGVGGIFLSPLGSNHSANDLVLQADNKSVFLGTSLVPFSFLAARVTEAGILDSTWNALSANPGYTLEPVNAGANAATIQSNGYIIGFGVNSVPSFVVARYISSPALTPTSITSPTPNGVIAPGSITFTGTAQNPSMVYIFIDGLLAGGVQTNASGSNSWSFTTTITGTGAHTVQAVSIYQNHKLNIASEIVLFTVSSCVIPELDQTSELTRAIINKYCCR